MVAKSRVARMLVAGVVCAVMGCSSGTLSTTRGDGGDAPSGEAPSSGDGSGSSDTANAQPLDTTGAIRVTVARGFCGGAVGVCHGEQSFVVDVTASTVEVSQCVDGDVGDAGDGNTTRTVSAENLTRLRDALAAIRIQPGPAPVESFDGQMLVLRVTTASGERLYSPEPACNHSQFSKVVAGWETLWDVASAL